MAGLNIRGRGSGPRRSDLRFRRFGVKQVWGLAGLKLGRFRVQSPKFEGSGFFRASLGMSYPKSL